MTEAVVDGGANAPAGVPIDINPASHNEPLPNQAVTDKKPEPAEQKPANNVDAIKQASEKLKAKANEETKPEVKPDAKADAKPRVEEAKTAKEPQPRENGKFASTQPKTEDAEQKPQADTPHRDAPKRFDDSAKAEWAKAPDSVKAATHRAIKELEDGFVKYRDDAKEYETVRYYGDLAKQGGTSLKAALEGYVQTENALRQDPVRGMIELCGRLGVNPADMATALFNASTGNAPQQQRQQQIDPQKLRYEIKEELKQEMKQESTAELVSRFRDEHDRYDELEPLIGAFLQSGEIPEYLSPEQKLAEAYALAERAKPAAKAAHAIPRLIPSENENAAQPAGKPLKLAGQKSISGSPANGSDPEAKREPSKSNSDALKKAARRLSA